MPTQGSWRPRLVPRPPAASSSRGRLPSSRQAAPRASRQTRSLRSQRHRSAATAPRRPKWPRPRPLKWPCSQLRPPRAPPLPRCTTPPRSAARWRKRRVRTATCPSTKRCWGGPRQGPVVRNQWLCSRTWGRRQWAWTATSLLATATRCFPEPGARVARHQGHTARRRGVRMGWLGRAAGWPRAAVRTRRPRRGRPGLASRLPTRGRALPRAARTSMPTALRRVARQRAPLRQAAPRHASLRRVTLRRAPRRLGSPRPPRRHRARGHLLCGGHPLGPAAYLALQRVP